MLWWLVLAGSLVALALCALLLPITLTGSAQGRGEPSGDWAVAGGLGFGPLAASFVAAPGVTPLFVVHLFGRKLGVFPLRRAFGKVQFFSARKQDETSIARFVRDLERASELCERALELLRADHRIRIEALTIALEYSFRDVALTGRLLGALYAVAAVLPERIVVRQTPRWDAEDRFTLEADLKLKLWPGRLAADAVRFMLKRRHPVQVT